MGLNEKACPKYQEIVNDILGKIHHGVYPPEGRLPSENQMAEIYGASVPTVRKALSELVYKEIIYRIKGNGTFVCGGDAADARIPNAPAKKRNGENICFLLLVDASDNSIMKMIRGAQKYLFDKGYSMSILCGEERSESEGELIRECVQSNVNGIIWFSANPDENIDSLRMLNEHNIPVVMLDRGIKNTPYTLVSCYNLDGGYQVTKYLIETGHTQIAFAADNFYLTAEEERFNGYRLALQECGIPYDERLCVSRISTDEQLEKLVTLVKKGEATAVQCVNDKMALRVMRRLEREGLHVPGDVSVSGFDGTDEAEYSYPRITTVIQPFEEMGRVAASRVLSMVAKKSTHTQMFLGVTLAVKESTAPPKK